MQNSIKFVEKSLKINMQQIKSIVKLEIIVVLQANTEVLQIACVV